MFVSITRLRIRSIWFLPGFFIWNERSVKQVRQASGFLAGAALVDRKLTFWTMSLWESEAAMKAYRGSGAHGAVMPKLAGWCDEGAVAHWEQPGSELPSWEEAGTRMQREGRSSKVRHPSANHLARVIPPPRTTLSRPLKKVG